MGLLTFKKLGDVFHLRHHILIESTLLDHPLEVAAMCSAGTTR